MCPEPQILSIYMDGELPSPWKEKMETHLTECSSCKQKFNNFKQMQELFKKDNQKQTVAEGDASEQELMEMAKERVWRNLESGRRFQPRSKTSSTGRFAQKSRSLMYRRFSIPIPAAAAAAIAIALITALWVRGTPANNNNYAATPVIQEERTEFILASEQQMPGIIPPTADINSVLQYLVSDRPDIIILQLPENSNFSRYGEPVMVRAADLPGDNHR